MRHLGGWASRESLAVWLARDGYEQPLALLAHAICALPEGAIETQGRERGIPERQQLRRYSPLGARASGCWQYLCSEEPSPDSRQAGVLERGAASPYVENMRALHGHCLSTVGLERMLTPHVHQDMHALHGPAMLVKNMDAVRGMTPGVVPNATVAVHDTPEFEITRLILFRTQPGIRRTWTITH